MYNLGQNIVDRLTELSKIGLSMEFMADFFFFSKIGHLAGWLGTCHQFQVLKGFPSEFPIS